MKRCFVSKGTLENREDNLAGINMDLTGVKRDLGSVTMDLVKGNIENYVFICFCIQLSLSFDKIGGVSAKKIKQACFFCLQLSLSLPIHCLN